MYCNTVTQIVVTYEVVVEVCCFLYAGLKGSPVCLVGESLNRFSVPDTGNMTSYLTASDKKMQLGFKK